MKFPLTQFHQNSYFLNKVDIGEESILIKLIHNKVRMIESKYIRQVDRKNILKLQFVRNYVRFDTSIISCLYKNLSQRKTLESKLFNERSQKHSL